MVRRTGPMFRRELSAWIVSACVRAPSVGETKSLKREFRLGHVRLKVIPKNARALRILSDGRDLGPYISGAKLELMEGIHNLELRGEKLSEPVPVEVNINHADITETVVDVSKYL